MTIDEAIKQFELGVEVAEARGAKKQVAALKLGIEALKRVELHRTDRRFPFNTLLPGETED